MSLPILNLRLLFPHFNLPSLKLQAYNQVSKCLFVVRPTYILWEICTLYFIIFYFFYFYLSLLFNLSARAHEQSLKKNCHRLWKVLQNSLNSKCGRKFALTEGYFALLMKNSALEIYNTMLIRINIKIILRKLVNC